MSKDYKDYVKPQSDDALAQLAKLAQEQLEAEQDIADREEELKHSRETLKNIAEVQIPELMEQMGLTEFTTISGLKIKVTEKLRASISAQNQTAAFNWLREHGHGALIKREIRMLFGMGEDDVAEHAKSLLEDLPVEDSSTVHSQTLVKFVGEMLKEGKAIPEELFSVHRQRVSKIKV